MNQNKKILMNLNEKFVRDSVAVWQKNDFNNWEVIPKFRRAAIDTLLYEINKSKYTY